jgi:hypothetical protein
MGLNVAPLEMVTRPTSSFIDKEKPPEGGLFRELINYEMLG